MKIRGWQRLQDMDSIQLMVDWWFGGGLMVSDSNPVPLSIFNARIPGIQTTRPQATRPQTTNLGRYQKLEERQQTLKNITPLRPQGLAFFSPESWLDITGGIFQGARAWAQKLSQKLGSPRLLKRSFRFFWGEG